MPRLWPGATLVCLGGGPSLTHADVDYCHGKARVVAVNDAYRLAPWADVLYGCDGAWWEWHQGVPMFAGLKVTATRNGAKWPGVQRLVFTGEDGLEIDPTGLRHGGNSGYQAINLAVHLGASRILLLGYDLRVPVGGPSHWFGEHPHQQPPPVATFVSRFASLVAPLRALGVAVINCTPHSALTMFPAQPLREALC